MRPRLNYAYTNIKISLNGETIFSTTYMNILGWTEHVAYADYCTFHIEMLNFNNSLYCQ